MRRREFITLFSGVVAGGPMVARAQQQKLPVISFLNSGSPAEWDHLVLAFNHGLNEAAFTVGRNVSIDYRWARLQYDRLPELAAELVRNQVAVTATGGRLAPARAAQAVNELPGGASRASRS